MMRKRKLKSLKILVGKRIAGHVFASGVLPAIDYGVEVTGFDDRELLIVQRIGAAATSAGQSGRSLTANRLIHGDPTWKAMCAPAVRWQKEVWRASFMPDDTTAGPDGRRAGRAIIPSNDLRDYWAAATNTQHLWYSADGVPAWSETRGPIGATVLSLERLGWQAVEWDRWVDDEGHEHVLSGYSPKLFRSMMYQSTQRDAQRTLAKAVAQLAETENEDVCNKRLLVEQAILRLELSGGECSNDPLADTNFLLGELDRLDGVHDRQAGGYGLISSVKGAARACVDFIRQFMRSKSKRAEEKNALAAVATNAVWTRQRLYDAGYDTDDTLCERCGVEADTLHHRLWRCQDDLCTRTRWDAVKFSVGKEFGKRAADTDGLSDGVVSKIISEACLAGPQSSVYNFGILDDHPGRRVPGICEMRMEWKNSNGTYGNLQNGDEPPSLAGEIFADGSCTKEACPELNRASWALVQIDSGGIVTQWVRGTVPRTIPQTSQGGEFTAALMAAHLSVGMTTLVDDCANVVDAFDGHYEGGEFGGTSAVSVRNGLASLGKGKLLSC